MMVLFKILTYSAQDQIELISSSVNPQNRYRHTPSPTLWIWIISISTVTKPTICSLTSDGEMLWGIAMHCRILWGQRSYRPSLGGEEFWNLRMGSVNDRYICLVLPRVYEWVCLGETRETASQSRLGSWRVIFHRSCQEVLRLGPWPFKLAKEVREGQCSHSFKRKRQAGSKCQVRPFCLASITYSGEREILITSNWSRPSCSRKIPPNLVARVLQSTACKAIWFAGRSAHGLCHTRSFLNLHCSLNIVERQFTVIVEIAEISMTFVS